MEFAYPTVIGTVVKRYQRFFTDLRLENGEIITAHTPNTGSMTSCLGPDFRALATFRPDPRRKLAYTLEMTHNGETWIGVNTANANSLMAEALADRRLPEFRHCQQVRAEVRIPQGRLDFAFTEKLPNGAIRSGMIEVKNVTLRENDYALFPDAVTTRGQKHLQALIELAQAQVRAIMVFVVQREDVRIFAPAHHIDPTYGALLQAAQHAGVEILAYRCFLSTNKIILGPSLPLEL